MKYIKFFGIGVLFGIVMFKAEIVSWYRIFEMFKFQSFHMYGIIGSAVLLGIVMVWFFNNKTIKNYKGEFIKIEEKARGWKRALFGGTIFGLGWALAGACPGPMFVLIGYGAFSMLIVIFGAILGAFLYGVFRTKLPH